jgi:lysine 6-dehydrogenase
MLAAMRIAVLGAGAMGAAAARLVARHEDADLVVADVDGARADAVIAAIGRGESRAVGDDLEGAFKGADALASCVPYRLNLEVMEAALAAGVPYADLGGLYHTTLRQLELDRRFRDAGVPALVGMGCCPGLSNVMARLGADRLDAVESIDLVDGSIDEETGFGVPYSAETILDEFVLPAMVFEDGELKEVPAASGGIRFTFPEPLGEMEAVYTLHSELATLPRTIEGVRDVRWRLALPPEIERGFRLLVDVGLASEEPVETASGPMVPRDVLRATLSRLPGPEGPPRDLEAMVGIVRGRRSGRPVEVRIEALFRPTPEGIGAGAFGTALPMAVGSRWLAAGRVEPGVHPPETAISPEPFLEELAREGVELKISVSETL